jgi:hypothetical protein
MSAAFKAAIIKRALADVKKFPSYASAEGMHELLILIAISAADREDRNAAAELYRNRLIGYGLASAIECSRRDLKGLSKHRHLVKAAQSAIDELRARYRVPSRDEVREFVALCGKKELGL